MIRYAGPEDNINGLWNEIFPGDGGYYEKDSSVIVYIDGEAVVSMLHWIMIDLNIFGKIYKCAYILGAGTKKEYRRRGLMEKLLEFASSEISHTGVSFVSLIPADSKLSDYYRRHGFNIPCPRMEGAVYSGGGNLAGVSDIDYLNEAYRACMDGGAYEERSFDRWVNILRDYSVYIFPRGYAVYDGEIFMEGSSGRIVGNHPTSALIKSEASLKVPVYINLLYNEG